MSSETLSGRLLRKPTNVAREKDCARKLPARPTSFTGGMDWCMRISRRSSRSERAREIGLDVVSSARKAGELAGGAPLTWSAACKSLEDGREMRLRLEA